MKLNPSNTDLGDLMEQEAVDIWFIAIPDNTETVTETVKTITITPSEFVDGIIIENNHLYGSYNNVFTLGPDSLKYRLNDEFSSASSWDQLPASKDTQLYLWKAPQSLSKTISYTVTVLYDEKTKSSGGGQDNSKVTDPEETIIEKQLVKVYQQTVVGNWSVWANKLREYVLARN